MALEILRIENVPVSSNCFILFDRTIGNKCLVVDPGSEDASLVDTVLMRNGFIPEYIILTHEHFDHIWSCNYLTEKYEAQIICSKQCALSIGDSKKNHSLFYNQKGFIVSKACLVLQDVQFKLLWGKYELMFEEAKGHTNAGLYFLMGHYLFTGDTLIKDLRTVTKLYTGSKKELTDTLKKIDAMKGCNYWVCPGHGECFDLDTYDMSLAL